MHEAACFGAISPERVEALGVTGRARALQESDPLAFDSFCAQRFPREQAQIKLGVTRARLAQSARKDFGKTQLQGAQHRLVHLVAALPDMGTDHRGDPFQSSQSLPQCAQAGADYTGREPTPTGVNGGDCAPAIAREQDRQAVRGHHRDAHADLFRNHRVRFGGLIPLGALFSGGDRNTVHLAGAPQIREFRKVAQAETVIDSDARQQRVPKRLRGVHF
jgi:hypothetical protein